LIHYSDSNLNNKGNESDGNTNLINWIEKDEFTETYETKNSINNNDMNGYEKVNIEQNKENSKITISRT
jgi:hypothetical protein